MVYDHTEGLPELLSKEKLTLYIGFDPTADSLHIGHLVPMMSLARLQRFGHTPIALAGGGTAMIGDPGGRTTERQLMSQEEVQANLAKVQVQLAQILDFETKTNPAKMVNNATWLTKISMMDFLRDVGKHFTVNYMVAKDSVKSRLDREDGISYTEFSYMLLQARDFLQLYDEFNCTMQAGGSDQWGNIVTGVELIRKVRGVKAHALVYPLITQPDGSKFGKTAAGTSVWLDPQRTSPYRFYQFWLNTDDGDVINYLRYFTWLTKPEIRELEESLFERPEKREASRKLASTITKMVHGASAVAKAEKASRVLFGGELDGLEATDIEEIFADVPSSQMAKSEFEGEGKLLVDLLASSSLASSKGDARRSIQGGGIYLNNVRISDARHGISVAQSIEGKFLVLRKGRRKYHLVRLEG
jgi:tyrosyl-tRNA synthetase